MIVSLVLAVLSVIAIQAQSPESPAAGPRVLARDSIRVVFWGDQREVAVSTLEAALAPHRLPGIPGAAVLPSSTIFLAPSQAVFDSLTFGQSPGWAAGVAIPSARHIVLPAFQRRGQLGDPVVTLRHELAHLALAGYLGPQVPRWFTEGYATWVSGGWDERSGWLIRLALLRGTATPLDSLRLGWPRGEARARLAYLLSASAVRHLATSRGDQAFDAFIAEWRREGTLDGAMRNVYQISPSQFEREWRSMVRRRYGWILAISQVGVFWGVFALLVVLLSTLRRRRNRERMDELRREEYMLPPVSGGGVDGYSGQE